MDVKPPPVGDESAGGRLPPDPRGYFHDKEEPSQRVARAVALTGAGLWWERGAAAFWPAFAIFALGLAALALGVIAVLTPEWAVGVAGAWVLGLGLALGFGFWRFRRPSAVQAVARVDARLPGRPLATLADVPALIGDGADALWAAHLAQARAQAEAARAVAPDADLARRDPFALRLAGLLALAMAMLFGSGAHVGQGMDAIAATFRGGPAVPSGPVVTGPGWEGWAEPPAYTRRPTIYLNALPDGEALELPKGTAFSFRLYTDQGFQQDIGPSVQSPPDAPAFSAETSGEIRVAGRRFEITVLPDDPPQVAPGDAPQRRADGRLVQSFEARDDHGLTGGEAVIALDLASVDRRFGLATDPEPRESVSLTLPAMGDRREVKGRITADLAQHPWANLPVTVSLHVTDGLGQRGEAEPMRTVLPGRRFFDPMASALIELRRDLLWSKANAGTSAEILRAITWQPEGFVKPELYDGLRAGVGMLEAGPLSDKARDDLAAALWAAAVELEDGGLSDALERMQRAQEKLSEAIRNGASPDEIQRLMDELKAATDAYTQMLAEQGQRDEAERFTRNQPGQRITGDQIQQMMDEIQRLMNEGRMAEAQELLEQFNRMMQNLQVQQAEGGGEGQGGAMGELADTLREQQRLSDEAFRQLQEQWSGPSDEGEGEDRPTSEELANRQRELREELGRQRGLLPGRGTEGGEDARRQLDEAGRAMQEAEEALRQGDPGGAMERQADAIRSMRDGMRRLADALAGDRDQGQQGEEGAPQEGQEGGSSGRSFGSPTMQGPATDPLGRAMGGEGGQITTGEPMGETRDLARRARDLLDEIRRRSAQADRPEGERDYLRRLLDRF